MVEVEQERRRPRLTKLIVKNFRCIGQTPVEIELDDIVVLVGPNNVGKSSILKAYQIVMSEGSREGELSLDDFPNGKIDENALPEIELHTIVYDNSPGEEWIEVSDSGEKLVREKWTWANIGRPTRRGFNIIKGRWANDTDEEKVPWGLANVANARRPQPHHVGAFDPPEKQAEEIIRILVSILNERIKTYKDESKTDEKSDYGTLLEGVREIQTKIVTDSQIEITKVQDELTGFIERIFPNYTVQFDARPEDDLDKTITLFKANPQLRMGPRGGYMSTMEAQGSGARRTLLWTALRLVSESPKKAKPKADETARPHVLLLEEPEICLHPNAIRDACDVLYDLPSSGNWQVMVTTHSPYFINMSRDNTSIVRVEIDTSGEVSGTTIFRPSKAQLAEDDKERLRLLNICDPCVTEFFFGGNAIIVEGDTEYAAFKYVIAQSPGKFKGIHIIRARGKGTIVSLVKILNHFGTSYAVLHDSDQPKIKKEGKEITHPGWPQNEKILSAVQHTVAHVRLVAAVTSFEKAFFNEQMKADKPYDALIKIRENHDFFQIVGLLLEALVDHSKPLPPNAIEWKSIEDLECAYSQSQKSEGV